MPVVNLAALEEVVELGEQRVEEVSLAICRTARSLGPSNWRSILARATASHHKICRRRAVLSQDVEPRDTLDTA